MFFLKHKTYFKTYCFVIIKNAMKIHRLHKKQVLPVSIESAWNFFSTPKNLNRITPKELKFKILSGADEPAFAGQIITYQVRPALNIPLTWVTEITQCVPNKYFIDEQRFGPYKFWHHLHRFQATQEGVLMEDILHYALPFGFIGSIAGKLFIHQEIEEIFNFRNKILSGGDFFK